MRTQAVTRLDDPRIAAYRDVREADLRAREGLFITEGRLNVKRLITVSRFRTRSVFVTEAGLQGIRPALERLDVTTPVYVGAADLLHEVVGYRMHRGCLAAGERGPEAGLAELLRAAEGPGARTLLVLEDVCNAENTGALFRNALAFGVDGVVLTRRSVDPLYRRAIRVSMGASLRVPFARAGSAGEVLGALRAAGFTHCALTPDAAPLRDLGQVPQRVALWVGSEGEGLSPEALAGAEHRVAIEMAPGADSLNVATAAGIALHHFRGRGDARW
jgi:tRNA G18 (ribose-2'-O)-methylase SpoU